MVTRLVGLVLAIYLLIGLMVGGGAVYGFLTHQPARAPGCASPPDLKVQAGYSEELEGGPNWMTWAAIRALTWPKSYIDDAGRAGGVMNWLIVRYDPFPQACGA